MRFQCPHCQGIVAIEDAECGEPVGCGHCGEITMVPKTRFSPGVLIGDFIIRDVLGHGGMGTVYLAHQLSLDRPVALKILMEQLSRNSDFIVDFVKEARAAASLNHPNIVQSYAVGEEGGIYYFAMEYVEGKTLKQLLETEGVLPAQRALTIGMQVAEALDFAWKNKQIVHRDIKPDNIMLTARGVAKLADLGLARAAHETLDEDEDMVLGTPQYICPEQLLGQPMDVRGDIYSLGATLYHAVTGRFPFDAKTPQEIARMHLQALLTPANVVNPQVADTVSFILTKMMAKRLEDRYEDPQELIMDFSLVLRGEQPVGFAESRSPKLKRPTRSNLQASNIPAPNSSGRQVPVNSNTGRLSAGGLKHSAASSQLNTPLVPQPIVMEAPPSAAMPPIAQDDDGDSSEGATAAAAAEQAAADGDATNSGDGTESGEVGTTSTAGMAGRPNKRIKMKKGASTGVRRPTGSSPAAVVPGATTPASGAAPAHKGLGVKQLALIGAGVLVVLLIVVGVGVMVSLNHKYKPANQDQALELYFERKGADPSEREDYNKLLPYYSSAETYKDNDTTLREVVANTSNFAGKFPQSLFVLSADKVEWKTLVPTTMGIGHAEIKQYLTPLAGRIPQMQTQYEELLLRNLRAVKYKEYMDKRKVTEVQVTKENHQKEAEIQADQFATQRKTQLEGKIASFLQNTDQKKKKLPGEQATLRKSLVDAVYHKRFDQAAQDLTAQLTKLPGYTEALETAVPNVLKDDEAKAQQFELTTKGMPGVDAKALKAHLNEQFNTAGIAKLRRDLTGLIAADKQFYTDREAWFKQEQQMLAYAKEYFEKVGGSLDKLAGHELRMPELKVTKPAGAATNAKFKVVAISRDDITLGVVFSMMPDFKDVQAETRTMPLNALPTQHLVDLAKFAWGTENLGDLSIRKAAYLTLCGRPDGPTAAKAALLETSDDLQKFVTAELDALLAQKVEDHYYELVATDLKALVKADKKDVAIAQLKSVAALYGATDVYKKHAEELQKAVTAP